MLFQLGQLVATAGVAAKMRTEPGFEIFCYNCLRRYIEGDWGDLCEKDKALNDEAMRCGTWLWGAYLFPEGIEHPLDYRLWIITEWDRSVTTLLFPSEY